jgi:AraC-like DNA-binding protein
MGTDSASMRSRAVSGKYHQPNRRLAVAIQLVDREACNCEISLDSVASRVGLSRSHLSRLLAKTGSRFRDRVAARRIEVAKELLAGTCASVKEIAVASGFRSTAHLDHRFRAALGRSPGQWRQLHTPVGHPPEDAAPGAWPGSNGADALASGGPPCGVTPSKAGLGERHTR